MIQAALIFNDLSIAVASSEKQAESWFTELIQTIADLIDEQVCSTTLNANVDLYAIDLIPDQYGYHEWLDAIRLINRELFELALQISTRTPVYNVLELYKVAQDNYLSSEFQLAVTADEYNALGAALLAAGISVSFASAEQWYSSEILINQLVYDENLKFVEAVKHRVRHAAKVEHVDEVIRDWRHNLIQKIGNTKQLLNYWDSAFSHLDICKEYQQSFPDLQGEMLESVINRLWQLEQSCCLWQSTDSDLSYPMEATPETSKTMAEKQFAQKRLFTCPYQGEQYFVMHCRIYPKGFRLHWLVNAEQRRITIGYIGSHLR